MWVDYGLRLVQSWCIFLYFALGDGTVDSYLPGTLSCSQPGPLEVPRGFWKLCSPRAWDEGYTEYIYSFLSLAALAIGIWFPLSAWLDVKHRFPVEGLNKEGLQGS